VNGQVCIGLHKYQFEFCACTLFAVSHSSIVQVLPGEARRAITSAQGAKESISWLAFHVKKSPRFLAAARTS
jgi:hypothetical protein